jgi:PIN domain nuclease of toxin-antitoxin system
METVAVKPRLKYLLDTHAFIWAATDDERLSPAASRAIAATPYDQLAIADVTLQEIGLLLHGNRVIVEGKPAIAFGRILDFVTVLPITLDIAIAAPALKLPHADQFDRIITATARMHRLTLLTRDANIADSGLVPTLW